jgi:hypothetical protein
LITHRDLIIGAAAGVAIFPVPTAAVGVRSTHVIQLIIEMPCLNCLLVGIYHTHHFADDGLAAKADITDLSGREIHEIAYKLENFTPHVAVGICPSCGREGMESSSAGLEHLSRVVFGNEYADDACYQYHGMLVRKLTGEGIIR